MASRRDEYETEQRIRVPLRTRRQITVRDGACCLYCGDRESGLQLDHVVPHCDGGPTFPSNLVLACPACNSRKGSMPVDLFAVWCERQGYGAADSVLVRIGLHLGSPLPILE